MNFTYLHVRKKRIELSGASQQLSVAFFEYLTTSQLFYEEIDWTRNVLKGPIKTIGTRNPISIWHSEALLFPRVIG